MSKPTEGDGYVSYTKCGEFACKLSDQGDLMAFFPDHGLSFLYDNDGKLVAAIINVGYYLAGLSMEEVAEYPGGGADIIGLVKLLKENEKGIYFEVNMESGSLELLFVDKDGKGESIEKIDRADFYSGVDGVLNYGGCRVCFEFKDYGDDFLIALGETDGIGSKLSSMEISHEVEFEDAFFGTDPQRFNRLAGKIIL